MIYHENLLNVNIIRLQGVLHFDKQSKHIYTLI
jgi:hypothetical protein